MRRNWRVLLALLMVMVLGAAACGGGDDSSGDDSSDEPTEDTEASGISEDDWVDEASGLCEDWFSEAQDTDGTDADEVADLAEATATFHDDLEDLGEPEDIADEADDLIDAVDDLAGALEQAAEELDDEGEISDDLDQEGEEANADMTAAAEELDLDCGVVSDDASGDFSDDFTDETGFPGDALDPTIFIEEYGTDAELDALADACYGGDFAACDQLYFDSPIEESTATYEGYGATCGGRLAQEETGQCQTIAGE
jgi:hypothetical protein